MIKTNLGARNFKFHILSLKFVFLGGALLSWGIANAQVLPSTIDPGRIEQPFNPDSLRLPDTETDKKDLYISEPPKDSENIRFELKRVELIGITAFSEAEIATVYQNFLSKEITLSMVWDFAAKITNIYREKGYFLSRAFVPKQEITDGVVRIEVYEGYLSEIIFPEANKIGISNIAAQTAKVINERPLRFSTLETFLLLLNDLPGQQFRSYIEPSIDPQSGKNASRAIISRSETKDQLKLSWDMGGSKLVGKHRAGLSYQGSLFPGQQTELSTLTAAPNGKLEYILASHTIPIELDKQIQFSVTRTLVSPGGDLDNLDIESNSLGFDASMLWKAIRTRTENLNLSVEMSSRTTRTNILETIPLVRERVRSVTGKLHYDITQTGRRHFIDASLTKGLNVAGASQRGDAGLSRANAEPDFTILRLDYALEQSLSPNFILTWATSAQGADTALHSFNEFGYGGSSYGRSYDFSQFTGDHGVSTKLELRHEGLTVPYTSIRFLPYVFYDIGRVWNIEEANPTNGSASSYGLGAYFLHQKSLSLNVGFALTDRIFTNDMQNTGNSDSKRILFQLEYRL
jgi:hemolysin activation/secretion protein